MESDSSKKNTFIDIGKMKLIAEYRCLASAKIVKIYTEQYEKDKLFFRFMIFMFLAFGFVFLIGIANVYYHKGIMIFFDMHFIIMAVFNCIYPLAQLYMRYSCMTVSKKNLDYAITGYNEWKWIFDNANLELAVDSKEMNQLQERFQACHSIYKFSMTIEDRQTIDGLV